MNQEFKLIITVDPNEDQDHSGAIKEILEGAGYTVVSVERI